MQRIVIPECFALPKAFKTIRDANRLAFLLFVCLRKQAFDTASKQKSLSTLLRGFVARSGFEPETSGL
jgi:hypothetical protein